MIELHALDMRLFESIHLGWRSPATDVLFLVLSYLGLGQLQAAVALVCLRWPRTKRFTLPMLVAILVSGIPVAQGLKKSIPRDRPSNLRIAMPQEEWLGNSFPSGHTTSSFAVAGLLLLMTWGTRHEKYGWYAMVWAFGVGLSRIYRGVHWPSDVLAGIGAGLFSAGLVYLAMRRLGKIVEDPELAEKA